MQVFNDLITFLLIIGCLTIMKFYLEKQRSFFIDFIAVIAGSLGVCGVILMHETYVMVTLSRICYEFFRYPSGWGGLSVANVIYFILFSMAFAFFLYLCFSSKTNIMAQNKIENPRKRVLWFYTISIPICAYFFTQAQVLSRWHYITKDISEFYIYYLPRRLISLVTNVYASFFETLAYIIIIPYLLKRLIQSRFQVHSLILDALIYIPSGLLFMFGHYGVAGLFDFSKLAFYMVSILLLKTGRSYFGPIYFHFIMNFFVIIG